MRRPLRILNHHIFYPPEPLGIAAYVGQMCEWLARQGHQIHVICPPPYYPYWEVQRPYKSWRYQTEILHDVHVTRCPIWIPTQPRGIARVLYAASFALSSLPALIREMLRRPDVVFVTEPSFLNTVASLAAAKCCGALSWMHVQDFELDIAFDMGQISASWTRRLARAIESFVMRRFDVVSTISGRMLERLAAKGVDERRCVLFPNWVDTAAIFPMAEPSPLRRELAIPDDAVVTLYSGSMGAKQGIEQLVDAARLLADRPTVRIVICGDGAGLAKLQALAQDLPNVRFLPLQPSDRLNALLNLADIHVLPQNPSVADLVMPSKLIGMLASGRPVVATAQEGSEVAAVVGRRGVVVPPENPSALAAAIAALSEDPLRRMQLGAEARAYATQNFQRDVILREFEIRLNTVHVSIQNNSEARRGADPLGPPHQSWLEMSAPAAATTAIPIAKRLPAITRASPLATGVCLLTADIAAVLLARLLGAGLWSLVNARVRTRNEFDLWMSLALFLLVYAAFGLYSAASLGAVEELRRIVLGAAVVSLVLTTAAFLSKAGGIYSRGVFLCSGLLVALLAPLHRAALRRLCSRKSWWGVPVLILGAGKTARALIADLRARPGVGMKPVACLDDDLRKLGHCGGVPVAGPLSLAPDLARTLGIRHAIVAMPGVEPHRLVSILERLGDSFSSVIVIPNLFGMATLWVSIREMGGVLGLEVRQNLLVPFNRWLKRTVDFGLAILLGLAAVPLLAVAALWIKLVSRGPAFYYQLRGGKSGRAIRVWKLRTMHVDADSLLSHHLLEFPEAREEWHRYFKLKQDPRILPGIGRLLRRTSLDELPQLWNVLRGEMSLVGPRPFPEYHLAQFQPEFRSLRAKVTPGLTGLWQVTARSNGDLQSQEALDTYYIRNWSPWLDLHILARTVRAVIVSDGAY